MTANPIAAAVATAKILATLDDTLEGLDDVDREVVAAQVQRYLSDAKLIPHPPAWHATPPDGWFVFGHHMDSPDVPLEFWGGHVTDDGMPVWERPRASAPTP